MECVCCCFFFQAEDGIRDATVTGVQTCALPISVPGTAKTAAAGGKTAEKVGRLTVVSGETDRKAYELTGHLTVIGAEDTATVKLTGWFAPKNAALISLGGSAYFISLPEGGKKITVNGEVVQGKKPLHDGDVIIIAGVHFQFSLK